MCAAGLYLRTISPRAALRCDNNSTVPMDIVRHRTQTCGQDLTPSPVSASGCQYSDRSCLLSNPATVYITDVHELRHTEGSVRSLSQVQECPLLHTTYPSSLLALIAQLVMSGSLFGPVRQSITTAGYLRTEFCVSRGHTHLSVPSLAPLSLSSTPHKILSYFYTCSPP